MLSPPPHAAVKYVTIKQEKVPITAVFYYYYEEDQPVLCNTLFTPKNKYANNVVLHNTLAAFKLWAEAAHVNGI